jgi:phosphomannomutase
MTNLAPIKFGTDGWRAVIAADYTFANVERVAQAYADYLTSTIEKSLREQLVDVGQLSRDEAEVPQFSNVVKKAVASAFQLEIIGFDRRFLSEHFAQRAAEVLAGNGFRIALFSEAAPTPLVSWAVKYLGASGGVVITASHN